ncbi:MAG: DUF4418 family protein [Candidatus Methanoplasma sp.]|jgi:hypothetical protein|nr:DUF4418 family protein [Candidatus Methanoplasma sp.]
MVNLCARVAPSAAVAAIGILIAFGPQPGSLFGVCEPGEMKMVCYYTAKAELWIGLSVAALGILSAAASLRGRGGVAAGIFISAAVASALAAAVVLSIGICGSQMMHCHDPALPAPQAILALAVIAALASAAGARLSVERRGD